MAQVYVPDLGFRPADGLRMPAPTVVHADERALAVARFISTDLATKVAIEVKDDRLEAECMAGRFDLHALNSLEVRLTDEHGRGYARSTSATTALSFGQHEHQRRAAGWPRAEERDADRCRRSGPRTLGDRFTRPA